MTSLHPIDLNDPSPGFGILGLEAEAFSAQNHNKAIEAWSKDTRGLA